MLFSNFKIGIYPVVEDDNDFGMPVLKIETLLTINVTNPYYFLWVFRLCCLFTVIYSPSPLYYQHHFSSSFLAITVSSFLSLLHCRLFIITSLPPPLHCRLFIVTSSPPPLHCRLFILTSSPPPLHCLVWRCFQQTLTHPEGLILIYWLTHSIPLLLPLR